MDPPKSPKDEVEGQQEIDDQETADEGKGRKRRLDQEPEETSNLSVSEDVAAAPTSSKSIPPGVDVLWTSSSDLIAKFDSSLPEGPDGTRFCIVGRAKLCCTKGKAEVLGHVLTPESGEVTVTSPFWSSWITIHVPSTPTEIAISSIRGEPSFRLVSPDRPTVIPDNWKECVDQIGDAVVKATPPTRDSLESNTTYTHECVYKVMICGAKGVGKSTLLRFMTNRLLQTNPVVAILDGDVGQPELAPPGVLRLSVQRRPLLQPPYWNVCEPEAYVEDTIHSVYYGAVTTKVDPTRYIQAVETLMEKYASFLAQSPVVVPLILNLDGWVKGMGYQVLCAMIGSVAPTHICQILGDSKGKTFELTNIINAESPATSTSTTSTTVSGNEETQPRTKLFELDACHKHVTPCHVPAATLRTLRLASYFGPSLLDLRDTLDFQPARQLQTGWFGDEECTLANLMANAIPYCVPLDDIDYSEHAILGSELQSDLQLLQALNGNIVGLCTMDNTCLGLGIVRSIDWKNRVCYLLTPLPEEALFQVTRFVGGSLPLPLCFTYRGTQADSFPYLKSAVNLTEESSILGTEPMKSRNNIGRKGNTGGG